MVGNCVAPSRFRLERPTEHDHSEKIRFHQRLGPRQREEWFTAPAYDGFVLAATSTPGAYDDAVRLLVPELNGAAYSRRNMPARRCARTWAWRYRAPPTGTPRAGRPQPAVRVGTARDTVSLQPGSEASKPMPE